MHGIGIGLTASNGEDSRRRQRNEHDVILVSAREILPLLGKRAYHEIGRAFNTDKTAKWITAPEQFACDGMTDDGYFCGRCDLLVVEQLTFRKTPPARLKKNGRHTGNKCRPVQVS